MAHRAFARGRVLLLVLATATLVFVGSNSGFAATICVNPRGARGCSSTIQAAVNSAAAGDTIKIAPGIYREMVTITKPLTLQGRGANGRNTIIDASGLAHAVYATGINTGPLVISRITARNANREGILIENSIGVTITNSTVTNNDQGLVNSTCPGAFPLEQEDCGEGLHLEGVAYSVVRNNIVKLNAGGILLTDETAATHDNQIVGNLVRDNTPDCGITLPSHPKCGAGSSDTTGCIGGPEIGEPAFGVFHNVVARNRSLRNGAAGTGIFTPTPGTASYGNLVLDNQLIDNDQGGVVMHSHTLGQRLNNNAIVGNVIAGNGGDPDSEGEAGPPVGIVIFSDQQGNALPIVGTIATANIIRRESVDVFVGTTAINTHITLNNLLGSGIGIQNAGSGTIEAAQNYWGCPNGPGAAGCSSIEGPNVLPYPFSGAPVAQAVR